MSGGTSGLELAQECATCITSSKAAGCAKPKFCPGVTGEPWCGSAKTTQCDTGVGTRPGSLTLDCCQQYANASVAEQCGGKPECPDRQMSQKTYQQLSGAEVSKLCDACFDLGANSSCKTIHFCPEETGYPWCSTKQMECDSLAGSDNLTGVTAAMGRGCCDKYRQDNTSLACGGMPCPDFQVTTGATRESCKSCFARGTKQNCTEISFCTKTHLGQDVWCGPKDGPGMPFKSCDGKEIDTLEGCDGLG